MRDFMQTLLVYLQSDAFLAAFLAYRHWVEIIAIGVAILIAISSVDDVFLDIYYWALKFLGNKHHDRRTQEIDFAGMGIGEERPFAIMVPAWREFEVIYSMLGTNSRLLRYQNYQFFVGVYENDDPTIAEVERIRQSVANITMVIVPRPGPTSKADCLNEIVASIFDHESKHGITFAGIALHDAEDLIHPHELQLFNLLIGRYDFIQLPVFSFNRPLREMVAGISMDEFAEVHSKDLIVREHLSGVVPCAGVSACFSRRAIAMLVAYNQGAAFDTSSFTEDYDVAFRMHELDLQTAFISHPVDYTIDLDDTSDMPVYVPIRRPICTREFFPSELRASYRQRARWQLGIVFQGSRTHGWVGSLGTKYFLMRDRKGLITSFVVILAYFVLANLFVNELYFQYIAQSRAVRFDLLNSPYVMILFACNFFFLLWRVAHRMYFTSVVYNFRHGLMSAPRLVVANFVNFFASVRAIRIYVRHRLTGKPLVWDKTKHSYPVKLDTVTPFPERGEAPRYSSRDNYRATG
jgi:adsorption protein B